MIAFLKSFSSPSISWRSSGIDVKPRRAKRTTPIGSAKFNELNIIRFDGFTCGRNLMKIPRTIMMIAMTPHVSIFFNPLRPSWRSRVMASQNMIPNIRGLMFPGRICDNDCPSPTRYAMRAE